MLLEESGIIKLSRNIILASSAEEKSFIVFDPKNLGILDIYEDDNPVFKNTLAYSRHYGYILGKSKTKTIMSFWNLRQTKPNFKSPLPENLSCFTLSESETFAYGASSYGNIYIWNTLTGELEKKVQAHNKNVNKLAVIASDSLLITASDDATIKVWMISKIFGAGSEIMKNIEGGLGQVDSASVKIQPIHTLTGHIDRVTDIFINRTSSPILLSGSYDKTVRLWDIHKGHELRKFTLESPVSCVLMDPSEDRAFIGTKKGFIKVFALKGNSSQFILTNEGTLQKEPATQGKDFLGHKCEVNVLSFESEQSILISGSDDGQIILWNMLGNIVKTLSYFTSGITNILVIPRPQEYTKEEDLLIKKKRLIHFQPFGKYQKDNGKQAMFLAQKGRDRDINEMLKEITQHKKVEEVLFDDLMAQKNEFSSGAQSNENKGGNTKALRNLEKTMKTMQETLSKTQNFNRLLFNQLYAKDKI